MWCNEVATLKMQDGFIFIGCPWSLEWCVERCVLEV